MAVEVDFSRPDGFLLCEHLPGLIGLAVVADVDADEGGRLGHKSRHGSRYKRASI